jgi:ribosomal protein S18 acetylase RimI-like enzyme
VAFLEDIVTYLEMTGRPARSPAPAPRGRSALMRVEACPVSFYRYLYKEVGEAWLWYERRRLDDDALAAIIHRPTTEIFVLYVGGAPAGYFELDRAVPGECELAYFGLAAPFIGLGWGRFLLDAADEAAWTGETSRVWVHTCTYDHPRALGAYQKAGFRVYDRRPVRFEDPRTEGILPRGLTHPRLAEPE